MGATDVTGYETIIVETDPGDDEHDGSAVTTITLNRPAKLNAWTPQLAAELASAIEAANDDPAVGAVLLTGAGRGFCAGADMDAVFKSRIDADGPTESAQRPWDWVGLVRGSKPIIAAIHGPAIGVGLTMVLPCDILVATADAKLGAVFIKVGVVPELASSQFLVQRVGWGKASEMCLTGRIVRGDEAAAIGLVDHVADSHDAMMQQARSLAAQCAANPALQARMIKRLLTENAVESDLRAVQRRELEQLEIAYASAEHKAAVAKFLR